MASSSRVDSLKKQYEENPRRYFAALANEYRKSGDLEQAIGLCRAHLPQQPSHISGHIVFGQALFEAGELAEARTVFETALGLDPENLIALRHLGDIASTNGHAAEARDWYTRILLADPRNDEIQALLDALPAADASPVEAPAVEVPEADAPAAEAGEAAAEQQDTASADAQALSDWAATLDAHASADYAPAPEPEPPPAAAVAPEDPILIDVAAPPVAAAMPEAPPRADEPAPHADATDEPFDFVAGGPGALRDGLAAPAPAEHPAPSAPESSASEHELEAGSIARAGFDLERAEPVTPPPDRSHTPPIGMEAIFEAEAAGLRDVISPDVIPTAHQPERVDEEPPAAAPAAESHAEPAAAAAAEQMRFAPPEREAVDDDLLAGATSHEADAAPSAFVTETMAELYMQQGFYDEALGVYRQLLARSPHDAGLRDRVGELEARTRGAAAPRRTARDFFGALALRRAPTREPMGEVAGEPTGHAASDTNGRAESASVASVASLGDALLYAPPELPADAPAAPDGPLAADLAGPAHTSEPLAFEGATATGVLAHHAPGVSEADLAAGAPVSTTDWIAPPEDAGAYHPPLDDSVDAGAPAGTEFTAALDAAAGAETQPGPELAPSDIGGSLDRLFEGRAVASGDEAAAASLASAFTGEQDVVASGKPTRPADGELSLDSVFRAPGRAPAPPSAPASPAASVPPGAPGGAPRPTGAFSFDQFFAEGGAEPGPADASADPGDVAGSDIEQFNAWLEGLKKK